MKTLDEIMQGATTDKSTLYHGYAPIYERLFSPYQFEEFTLLEIGVQFGFSIKAWLEYFPNARIVGVDVGGDFRPDTKRYAFYRGDQGNIGFMDSIPEKPFIVIDDGGHIMHQIAASFNVLWPKLESGGLYCIEDWFAVAHDDHFKSPLNAVEWLSEIIACVHWHGKSYYGKPEPNPNPSLTQLEETIASIEIYKGLIVIKKK